MKTIISSTVLATAILVCLTISTQASTIKNKLSTVAMVDTGKMKDNKMKSSKMSKKTDKKKDKMSKMAKDTAKKM